MSANCHCKGVRACALCEHSKVASHRLNVRRVRRTFVFCPDCSLCFEVDPKTGQKNPLSYIRLEGIELLKECITSKEEAFLEESIESSPWAASQSGRQKQDFGPKVNFKKQKVKTSSFSGFPSYMDLVKRSFLGLPSIESFEAVELCNLKYCPEKGSCIDPHFDDWWLWGERLVTLNLKGATVLTFSRSEDFSCLTQRDSDEENEYGLSTKLLGELSESHGCNGKSQLFNQNSPDLKAKEGDIVHVVLPRRSVVLVKGDARFKWHHSVLREHIQEVRLAMTCRELSNIFMDPQNEVEYAAGLDLLERAKRVTNL